MREKLLFLLIMLCAGGMSAQFVLVNAPEDCKGALSFGQTASWGAFLTDDIWTGDLVLVNDGTALPTEACSPLVNGAEVTGNFALIDRGSCNFSLKALNAQNAGATAVVIANHTPGAGTLTMGAGSFATDVTIPVVMISWEDGQKLKEKMNNGDVVNMSIGNIRFNNDIGTETSSVVFPGYSTLPANQIETAGNFAFIPGASVSNNGINDATNVILEATIDYTDGMGNSSQVYDEAGSTAGIESDSSSLIILSDFDPSAYGEGVYDYTYTVSSDSSDEVTFDNTFNGSMTVSGNVYSKARWDHANNRPFRTNGFTIAGGGSIEMLTPFEFPNGTDLKVDSVLFSVSTSNPTLATIAVTVFLYSWDDADGDGNFADGEVEFAGIGFYEFPASETRTTAWVTVEIEDLLTGEVGYPVPGDGARLVVGTRYEGADFVFFGFDEGANLNQYINGVVGPAGTYNDAKLPYAQTTTFGPAGADFGSIGLFTDTWFCSSTSLYVNSTSVANEDLSDLEANVKLFPNPTTESITLDIELTKLDNAMLNYQIVDMQGRVIYNEENRGMSRDHQTFDVSQLTAGQYELIIEADQGRRTVGFIVE
jgi:hypothetical protein